MSGGVHWMRPRIQWIQSGENEYYPLPVMLGKADVLFRIGRWA